MRRLGINRLLSGVALTLPLAVVLAVPTFLPAQAQAPATVEAAVPMPGPAEAAPPTAIDVTTPTTQGIAPSTETAAPAETAAPPETTATIPAENAAAPAENAAGQAPTPADTAAVPMPAPAANAPPVESTRAPTENTVAVPAPAADPITSLNAADQPIAQAMRDLLPKSDRIFSGRKERAVVEAFYQKRNYAPVWFERGAVHARASAATARIHGSQADGLIPAEYKIPDFTATTPEAQADAELRFTATLITFTRHLQAGRFPFHRMGGEIMLPQEPPDVTATLNKLAVATNVAAAIDEFSPPQPAYRALKAKLAELRGASGEETRIIRVPDGPMLRPGMEDERVPVLRHRLQVAGDETSLRYDEALVTAVKAYQKANRMKADGLIGASIVRSLNAVSAPRRTDVAETIIANMERWRWQARDMGNAHVVLNIPNFTLRVMHNGREVWTTRVVVGKPSTPTPLLTETMKYITVNPTWNVPPSIVRNEYLPALAQDSTVLSRMGLRVQTARDGSVHISQPPGDNNALGRLRFNFPNPFLVYQHDTPDKHLFSRDVRAFSHGCMRVQDPPRYAEVLLSIALPGAGYTAQKIRSMYGPNEHDIRFPTPIPVHITYQTAFVDDAGQLQVRPDIYNLDTKTRNLIRSERGVVEPTSDRAPLRPAPSTVQHPRSKDAPRTANGGGSGTGFLDALFGVQPQQQAPAPRGRAQRAAQKREASTTERPLWSAFGPN